MHSRVGKVCSKPLQYCQRHEGGAIVCVCSQTNGVKFENAEEKLSGKRQYENSESFPIFSREKIQNFAISAED